MINGQVKEFRAFDACAEPGECFVAPGMLLFEESAEAFQFLQVGQDGTEFPAVDQGGQDEFQGLGRPAVDRRIGFPGEVGPQRLGQGPLALGRQPGIDSPARHAGQGPDSLEPQLRPFTAEGFQEHFQDLLEFIKTPEVQQLAQEGQAFLHAQLVEVATL